MQKHGLKQAGNRQLLIIVLGWACDLRVARGIMPPGYDLLYLYDFRTIEKISPEELSGYASISLIAWSFGVWVAERVLGDIALHRAIALNGTPYPVHNHYGIPEKPFVVTLKGIARARSIEEFNRRTYGSYYETQAPPASARTFAELYDELEHLFAASRCPYTPTLSWSHAIVGGEDRIFPPANMTAYWKAAGAATQLIESPGMPHFPFADPQAIVDLLESGNNTPPEDSRT